MSEARAIPDSIGPFLRALRRSGSSRSDRVLLPEWFSNLYSREVSRGDATQGLPTPPQDQTAELLSLVTRQGSTPADELLRSSRMKLEDFAKALKSLQETGLVKLVDTPTAQLVEATPLGHQLAHAR